MSQKKKTTAQSKRPRKAPSNQTGGTAWGKKAAAAISGKMQSADVKKLILLNFPYIIAFYMVEKAAWLYRYCNGDTIVDRLMVLFMNFGLAYKSYLPSFHPFDLLVGLIGAAALKAVIYFKGKNAKKYRQGEEYGSARWGNAKDMEPFIDPVFENNVLLTQTERLMMSGRPKHPKYARNKNVIVIGGSGSGKTRFFVKPNLMQMPEKVSYVCTDPKGTIIIECGKMLSDAGYKIKVLNTINFKKSMHYNPFHYIRSEKDILKLVNTIIANTKGDGEKSGEDFWVKAERLLYCALIGYIYYEAPEEEQNFSTLLEFINASEAREDDEEFKNPVDELFEDLEKAKPEHFAVRQYKKYKLAAGKTAKSIMRYLQYDTLQKLHLGHFDSWAASFGETVTAIELSPEGTGYRAKTRFARFFNLPELISLFKESADVQTADMLNLPVPEAEYINEVLKPSETQQEMVSSFADRAEQVRNGNVNPKIDNMLKITNDGRKLALDQRLINNLLPDEPESKVNLCVENAYQVWEESTPDKSTQLIFCDLSTPKADGTFNVYDDVREKLVAKGIPREEIAFIHEANTETKKAELFAKVRSGQVRILLGSTPKLGAGTNIQDRLIALHHLDCPWKPSDLEQQEGRILRQGNRNQKVKIFRYVTENTFDSYMWQILENKQKFISQIMTSKSPVRACDDVDDTALTYAEIKALATGNPYIKEKMDLDIQVSKLKLMRANHTSQIYSLESDIARRYPAEITAAKERIAGLKADLAVAKPLLEQDKEKFSITVEDRVYTDRKEAGSAILAACAAMKIAKTEGQIADLGGFAISSRFDAFAQTFKLTIKRQSSYTIELGSDPAGNIQRILNALASIEKTLPQVERRLETLQQQLAEAKEEVQRPFPQEAELNEKSARLAELNALLDMDEKGDDAALGMDEEVTDSELPAPKREIERSADSVKRPSILAQLHEKQAERIAEPKPQKKKSHDMEL